MPAMRSGEPEGSNEPDCRRRQLTVPVIEEQEELAKQTEVLLIERSDLFLNRLIVRRPPGAPPQTPPTFRLNRREPPAFDRLLWTCWRRQHRRGVGNRVPGFLSSRIPLSSAHVPELEARTPPNKGGWTTEAQSAKLEEGILVLYPPKLHSLGGIRVDIRKP